MKVQKILLAGLATFCLVACDSPRTEAVATPIGAGTESPAVATAVVDETHIA